MRTTILISLFLTLLVNFSFAQIPPEAFNYSGVARDASNQPIMNTTIGIQISILQSSTTGPSQYVENHFVITDENGIFNLIVGAGLIQSGVFNTIDWSTDNFYIKVGLDINGGTNFLTMGVTQLLSVPYAMHAKTAETVVNTTFNETDPIFSSSVSAGINTIDTSNWNNKLELETDPIYSLSIASDINASDTSNWNNKLDSEIDPIFNTSIASGITSADTSNWNNKLDSEVDPFYSNSIASGINSSDTTNWNNKLDTETDPLFNNSISAGIQAADTANWNNKVDSESDPLFIASVAAEITETDTTYWSNKQDVLVAGPNISISGNTISAATLPGGNFTHYIGEEFGGGVVFHLWKDSQGFEHGLVVDYNNLGSSVWSNVTTSNTNLTSWDGATNNDLIIQEPGHTNSAALLCANSTNGGQNDWYLPSIAEANLLFTNIFNVNMTLSNSPSGSPVSSSWTSCQESVYTDYAIYFQTNLDLNGQFFSSNGKLNTVSVRAIRSF